MSTIIEYFPNMTKQEANILIEKYLDIVEDLEDYLAIKNHQSKKTKFLSEKEITIM